LKNILFWQTKLKKPPLFFYNPALRHKVYTNLFIVLNRNFRNYSKKCGNELDQDFLYLIREGQKHGNKKNKRVYWLVYQLLKDSSSRIVITKMFFLWMVIVMYYFALLLGILPGSVLLNNAVNGAMEGCGALFAVCFIGKKWCKRALFIRYLLIISGNDSK
jgi:hypothetical protein